MEKPDVNVTACLIVIGDEILSGRTRDANLAHLGLWLNELGIRLNEARVIPDDAKVIADTVNACRTAFDYVFTTGGIGPTHDDITSESIARALDLQIEVNDEAYALLRDHYGPGGLNDARLRMARMPRGATLIENPISKAPGFRIENIFVMVGIPAVMRAMLESLRHEVVGGAPVLSRSVAAHMAESLLAGPLGEIQDRNPGVQIGSYPFFQNKKAGANLVMRSTKAARLDAVVDEVRAMIRALGGEPIETSQDLKG
ncbi:MAG: competence/damage-inducible protein A [Sphingomonadales bacterium]